MNKNASLSPIRLRCEYLENPLGIDALNPRLSWIIPPSPERRGQVQTAYRILVAGNVQSLGQDIGDIWDSGKVESDRCSNVPYGGSPLVSRRRCFWKVRCWDEAGRPGTYSEVAFFEMGFLAKSDWKGQWICADAGISSPIFRIPLRLDRPATRARVYICGLGYYELFINGKQVGDSKLDPASTYFNNDQPFELHSRVLYVTYDVSDFLQQGENVIGVMLGNGWYSAEPDVAPAPSHRHPYGNVPVLLAQVEVDYAECGRDVWVSGALAADESSGIRNGREDEKSVMLDIGSGTYSFERNIK